MGAIATERPVLNYIGYQRANLDIRGKYFSSVGKLTEENQRLQDALDKLSAIRSQPGWPSTGAYGSKMEREGYLSWLIDNAGQTTAQDQLSAWNAERSALRREIEAGITAENGSASTATDNSGTSLFDSVTSILTGGRSPLSSAARTATTEAGAVSVDWKTWAIGAAVLFVAIVGVRYAFKKKKGGK